ncbi:MAG: low molecular weight phosphotyrosine protein phosphatase [Bacteroidales bacterium]|nr:low molecular weight phosphotyrosine protein phosphatase [Bacteroidales bacterium]
MKYLMVCYGNICRSPMAKGLLRDKLKRIGKFDSEVDSCGFEPYHIGDPADARAIEIMKKHGYDITDHVARLFHPEDFEKFDKIFVMDAQNYHDVISRAKNDEQKNKVDYIMNLVYPGKNLAIPDPYYGTGDDFEKTFEALDKATDKILELFEN